MSKILSYKNKYKFFRSNIANTALWWYSPCRLHWNADQKVRCDNIEAIPFLDGDNVNTRLKMTNPIEHRTGLVTIHKSAECNSSVATENFRTSMGEVKIRYKYNVIRYSL